MQQLASRHAQRLRCCSALKVVDAGPPRWRREQPGAEPRAVATSLVIAVWPQSADQEPRPPEKVSDGPMRAAS